VSAVERKEFLISFQNTSQVKPLHVSPLNFAALSPVPYTVDVFDFEGTSISAPLEVPTRYNEAFGWVKGEIS
jgi:hypothetical protein